MESSISVCHSTTTVTANCAVVSGSQSDSKMVCCDRLFSFCGDCASVSFGSGVKFKLGCNAW